MTRSRMIRCLLAAVLAVVLVPVAGAAEVTVDQPWARATIGQVPNGVAYLSVTNHGHSTERVIAAATPVADHASLHTHVTEGGMMRMKAVEAVTVAPGATVSFEPGGLHVMLMGLHKPLREGDRIELTLTFERAGERTVEVPVLAATSMGAGEAGGHGGMKMGHGGMKMK